MVATRCRCSDLCVEQLGEQRGSAAVRGAEQRAHTNDAGVPTAWPGIGSVT